MPVKKQSISPSTKVKQKVTSQKLPSIPSARTEVPERLTDYMIVIYGMTGIGKTSLVDQFGKKVLFFRWEAAQKGLSLFATPLLQSWEEGVSWVDALEQDKRKVDHSCFDTGDPAYKRALEFICKRENCIHPSDKNDYGKTWGMVRTEFENLQKRFQAIDIGLSVTSHEKITDRELFDGRNTFRIEPNFSPACLQFYWEFSDVIGYYHFANKERWLQIVGDDYVMAKSNVHGHFKTTNNEKIHRIPMGNSEQEAYEYLIRAFNNKQKETYADLTDGKPPEKIRQAKFEKKKRDARRVARQNR
jgi:hypothetical protein